MKILIRTIVLMLFFGVGISLMTYLLIGRESLTRTDIADQEIKYLSERVGEFLQGREATMELTGFDMLVPEVLARVPVDPWGNEYLLSGNGNQYRICTGKKDICVLFDGKR